MTLPPAVLADRALLWHWLAEVFLAAPSADALAALRDGAGRKWLAALATEPAFAAPVAESRRAGGPAGDGAAADAADHRLQRALPRSGRQAHAGAERLGLERGRAVSRPGGRDAALLADCDLASGRGCCERPTISRFGLMLLAHLETHADPRAGSLRDRLRLWLPGFCAAVRAEDRTGFFAGAAALLLAALVHDELIPQPEERTVK
uniref:DorD n=1 Tax=Rhodobacter capsulatus TaxID=1061 RepID=P95588_RHOCA|nr:DorD [Rhodobacter capsulatus]